MSQYLGQISIVVRDYDEAIQYYTQILGFTLIEDTQLSEEKRWVVIRPVSNIDKGCNILLAKASTPTQAHFIGNQTGGRVFLFLYTDNIQRDYTNLLQKGVPIVRPLSQEAYGQVLVFSDLYGNLWDLIEPI